MFSLRKLKARDISCQNTTFALYYHVFIQYVCLIHQSHKVLCFAVTWRGICWHLCPRSSQAWSSCYWCMYHPRNLESTHSILVWTDYTYWCGKFCMSVCIYCTFVCTQRPEQQQHQHSGSLHFQQHDPTGNAVSDSPSFSGRYLFPHAHEFKTFSIPLTCFKIMHLVTLSSLFPVSNIFQFMDIFWGISHIPLKIYNLFIWKATTASGRFEIVFCLLWPSFYVILCAALIISFVLGHSFMTFFTNIVWLAKRKIS